MKKKIWFERWQSLSKISLYFLWRWKHWTNSLQKHFDDINKWEPRAFIRSRQRWWRRGTQFRLFSSIRKKWFKNRVSDLNINGILTHEPRSIAGYCSSFYRSLYESRFNEKDTNDFWDSLNKTKSRSEDRKHLCDNSLCIEEVLHAIKELKWNKSLMWMDQLLNSINLFLKNLLRFSSTFFSEYRLWKASTHPHTRLHDLHT